MTIKASGSSLSFTEIAAEFGNPLNNQLGNYRVTFDNTPQGGSFSNLPLDAGIPQSGQIKFSDFYSKQLNIVVKGYGGGAESWASKNAAAVYDNNEVEVIGNPGKTRPQRNATEWQGGKTVKINVNKTIGSSMPATNKIYRCALKTGSWPSETALSVDVGGGGVITGQGGGGGNGASGEDAPGGPGETGSSALGIQYSPINVNVAAGGVIQNGYGGGGGGGGAVRDPNKEGEDDYFGGGGGGGGAGFPNGGGGTGAPGGEGNGSPGGGSSTKSAGGGGAGGGGYGGPGGRGGDVVAAQLGGSPGNGSGPVGGGGPGGPQGSNGDAIRATMSQSGNVFISNSGEIRGTQRYSVPISQIT